MKLDVRDRVATLLVAAAMLIYGLWRAGVASGIGPVAVAIAILGFGFVASASAVVPGFAALVRGSRAYLAAASLVGLVALVAGVLTVVNATEDTLLVLSVATLALWTAATLRHRTTVRHPATLAG